MVREGVRKTPHEPERADTHVPELLQIQGLRESEAPNDQEGEGGINGW